MRRSWSSAFDVREGISHRRNELHFDRRVARQGGHSDGRPAANSVRTQFGSEECGSEVGDPGMGREIRRGGDIDREAEDRADRFALGELGARRRKRVAGRENDGFALGIERLVRADRS